MRLTLAIVLLLFCQLAFSQYDSVVFSDSTAVANLTWYRGLKNISGTRLSKAEQRKVINLTRRFIKQHNKELKLKADQYGGWKNARRYKIRDLDAYTIQIMPYLNEKGEKEVYINGFCDTSKSWKKEIIIVMDGGNCYFSMSINLSKETLISSGTNGYS